MFELVGYSTPGDIHFTGDIMLQHL